MSMKLLLLLLLAPVVSALVGSDSASDRPRLQIINGSAQTVDVFQWDAEGGRVPAASVEPSGDHMLTTTLGQRFAVVGRKDKVEAVVTATVPVQTFRYQPRAKPTESVAPEGSVGSPPDDLGIPPFYTKYLSAHGYPIVASARVSDYALKEAAYLVDQMLAQRPEVRAAMIQSGARMCIGSWNELITQLPEYAGLTPKDFWDVRARGLGGSERDPYCSCGEENLLGYRGDPNEGECILIHEFAHNVHLRGMSNVDSTFDRRLQEAYEDAMSRNFWKGTYAATNHAEYFAVGVQAWFHNGPQRGPVRTRVELQEYDPGLAALCREVFGDNAFRYTAPATRRSGHLTGYDPAKAPAFVWPERLRAVRERMKPRPNGRTSLETAIPPGGAY